MQNSSNDDSAGNDFDLNTVQLNRASERKKRLIRRLVNVIASIALAFSLLTTTAMGAYLYFSNKGIGPKQNESDLIDEEIVVSNHSGVSYILVLGVDVEESLTDIMVVACIDHEKNTLSFLQIPRDLFVGDDIPSGKINAVYSNPRKEESKINALRRRLSGYLGIPIDHYVLFTIKGFINVIDALGGVTINIKQENGVDIKDYITEKHQRIGPGWVTLKGSLATGFVRKRLGEKDGYTKGDIDRIEAQRIVYVALAKKLQTMSFSQMWKIAKNCSSQVTTDMKINEILGYANEAKGISLSNMNIHAIPGQPVEGYKGHSVYSIYKSDYVQIFNTYFNPYGTPITVSGIRIPELYSLLGHPRTGSYVDEGGTLGELMTKENQQ